MEVKNKSKGQEKGLESNFLLQNMDNMQRNRIVFENGALNVQNWKTSFIANL